MYKVLIVDDEAWTLKGIRSSFRWNELGFEIIAGTTSSMEALYIIETKKPEVVITDIRMPQMDGIELIKKVREKGIDSEFIILSGFAEFNYAKNALKYNVFDYLLKPIDVKEGINTFKKLSLHLIEKSKIEKQDSYINLIEKLLNRDSDNIASILKRQGLESTNDYYQVIVLKGEYLQQLSLFYLNKRINFICLSIGHDKNIFIINCRKDLSNDLSNCLLREEMSGSVIGVSSVTKDIVQVINKFREADIASYNNFISEKNGVYKYRSVKKNVVMKAIKEIIEEIKSSNSESNIGNILKIPEVFLENKLGMEELTLFYNELIAFINVRYTEKNIENELEFLSYNQIVQEFTDIHNLCEYLNQRLNQTMEGSISVANTYINDNFMKLLEYIDVHYNEKISLNELSEKFYINLTYICDLFKKVKGKTFTKYLMDLRLEKASGLLQTTSMPIYEVAEAVGYEYIYFYISFKKAFNMTPTQYRKEKTENC